MNVQIRTLTAEDVLLCMQLKTQAGWNQTEVDVWRFLDLAPHGCFVAEVDGRGIGTVASFVFDTVGWIAMMLVEPAYRGKGIGTQLMEHSIAYLQRCGVRSIRLDATPMGRPVYLKLGFVDQFELVRLEGMSPPGEEHSAVGPLEPRHLEAVLALDEQVTRTRRKALIQYLHRDAPGAARVFTIDDHVLGYMMLRVGARATQIGPIIVTGEEAGRALGDAAFRQCTGRTVFVDVPIDNVPALHWAQSKGLIVQRRLTRMVRGEPVIEKVAGLWTSSGPEKG